MSATAEVLSFIQTSNRQLELEFDSEYGVLWGRMNPLTRPTFNLELLAELGEFVDDIRRRKGMWWSNGRQHKISYSIIASKLAGVFNLGGDLALFRDAIRSRNRGALVDYGKRCIDNLLPWSRNCDLPLTTISLVQGDALGGGFECALSSTVLIAEESARMGFPEILFNLFPGMGAYSFLSRKVGRRLAEEIIASGHTYTARQLHQLGVVDVLASDGGGEAAVYSYVRKHARAALGYRAIEKVRTQVEPVTYTELLGIVNIWADTALQLDARDLKMMDRLVRAQNRNVDLHEAAMVKPRHRVTDLALV